MGFFEGPWGARLDHCLGEAGGARGARCSRDHLWRAGGFVQLLVLLCETCFREGAWGALGGRFTDDIGVEVVSGDRGAHYKPKTTLGGAEKEKHGLQNRSKAIPLIDLAPPPPPPGEIQVLRDKTCFLGRTPWVHTGALGESLRVGGCLRFAQWSFGLEGSWWGAALGR